MATTVVEGDKIRTVVKRRNELMMAPFRLSLWAQRLFLYVISQVDDKHTEDHRYVFSIADLAHKVGVEHPNLYRGLIEVVDELEQVKVALPAIDGKGIVRVGLIKNRQRFDQPTAGNEGPRRKEGRLYFEGKITLELWSELLPYVRDLRERYTEIELREAFRLGTTYGQKLYDILKTQEFHRRPYRVRVEDLRKMLGCTDWSGRFPDFRRFVLERAQQDIHENTEMRFQFIAEFVGKRVDALTFTLANKHVDRMPDLGPQPKGSLEELLIAAGLSAKEARAAVEKWAKTDPERIRWHVAEVNRLRAANKIRSAPVAWLRAGLKADYRPNPVADRERRAAELERERDAVRTKRAEYAGMQSMAAKIAAFGDEWRRKHGGGRKEQH